MTTKYFIGTSGHSYLAWKGTFYPRSLPSKEMLEFYASQFSAVENNGTFRKLPSLEVAQSWTTDVPKQFRFALKAPQSITHYKRLKDVDDVTSDLIDLANALKKNRGPILFQLPPNFKKYIDRLETFLTLIDQRAPVAFEFRHISWFDSETLACLKRHKSALCIADAADLPQVDLWRQPTGRTCDCAENDIRPSSCRDGSINWKMPSCRRRTCFSNTRTPALAQSSPDDL